MKFVGMETSLDAVGEAVFISKCHLCEIFRLLVGRTFGDYVRQQRLPHAHLLLTTTTQFEEIAQACGFQSVTYFAAVFKGEMDMSPTQFRRSGACNRLTLQKS